MPSNAAIFDYASQSKTERVTCPVCEAPTQWPRLTKDRYGFRVRMTGCSCGLTYLTEVMIRDGYAALYAGDPSPYRQLVWTIEHAKTGVKYDAVYDKEGLLSRQRVYGQDLLNWVPLWKHLSAVTTVLDAGGSTGVVAQIVAPQAKITVLDPSTSELSVCSPGVTTIPGFLEDPITARGPFDLVLFCETVDHLVDPVAAMNNLRDVTGPGGIMYVDFAHTSPIKIDHSCYFDERAALFLLFKTGWHVLASRSDSRHVGFLCQK